MCKNCKRVLNAKEEEIFGVRYDLSIAQKRVTELIELNKVCQNNLNLLINERKARYNSASYFD